MGHLPTPACSMANCSITRGYPEIEFRSVGSQQLAEFCVGSPFSAASCAAAAVAAGEPLPLPWESYDSDAWGFPQGKMVKNGGLPGLPVKNVN